MTSVLVLIWGVKRTRQTTVGPTTESHASWED